MHAHDCMAAVGDLRQLIKQIAAEELKVDDVDSLPLLLVGNSVGCALARIYAQQYKGTVAGVVLLDSVLANSDFVSIVPDPDSPDFSPEEPLPEGVTVDKLREARAVLDRTFHPKNGSKEGLSRKNLAGLLPYSNEPRLPGVKGGKGPFLTVVGHDFETFAQGSLAIGMPYSISIHYVNPYWRKYNQGLARLTEGERSKGPLIASGADHFIQRDNPDFVAVEVSEVLYKIAGELGVFTQEY
jgi:pimeloyl-ACP methyl ester carboxylesterase